MGDCKPHCVAVHDSDLTAITNVLLFFGREEGEEIIRLPRREGSAVGLQLRVRFVPAALLAVLRTALALRCVSKARDWTSHVDR
jgi:hypothetical protein